MFEIKKNWWVYAGIFLFIVINTIFVYNEVYLFTLSPLVLLLVLALFLTLDKLLLALVFLVPLSIPLSELVPGLPIDMFLPTEPLLAGILLLFGVKILLNNQMTTTIWRHPVSISIYLYLGWMLITSITSSMPLVSIKYLVSRMWFIAAFYFLATQLFQNPKNIRKYITLYAIALTIVVFYALVRHVKYGIFDEKIAHWSANPFYKDHTSYGAMLAFFIPPMIGITLFKGYTPRNRVFFGFITLVLFTGFIFSYSRAAWVSLIGAFGIWIIIKLRIKLWIVFSGLAFLTLVFLVVGNLLMRDLKSNKQDSSTNLAEHVQSISNVSTD
ncbi:MAG: O-antigen ligase family protein, partial [Salinivirgaceae bacterium]|nr:O-antigen ligase family protein [Salinivirgaceae bacterium]